ncbi:MAG: BolA/IbaG family iron-sulfur metabolism protein [Holosporaceae bacterium]
MPHEEFSGNNPAQTMSLEAFKARLEDALRPSFLEVEDGSAAHQGHAGAADAGPISHLVVRIKADALQSLSQVEQHQRIYALFQEELASGALHALRIDVL